MSKEIKVGIVVFIGFIVFGVIYWFLDEISIKSSTYELYASFDSIEKIDKGAQVRLSGFKVGSVTDIELTDDLKAQVTLKVDNNIEIPSDSYCVATTGAIIGEVFIKVFPGTSESCLKNGDNIKTDAKVNFDDITANVNNLILVTEDSMKKVNLLLSNKDIVSSLKNINSFTKRVDNLTASVNELVNIARPDITNTIGNVSKASDDVAYTARNIAAVSDKATSMANNIEKFVNEDAIPNATGTLVTANETMQILKETVISAKSIVDDVKGKTTNIQNILNKVDTILAKIDYTTIQTQQLVMNLNEASASINGIVSDEKLKKDLMTTADNIRETTQQTKELATSLNIRFGSSATDNTSGKISADTYYNSHEDRLIVDTFADIYKGKNGIKVGVNDLGEDNRFTIMYGRKLNEYNILRAGIYKSYIGLGYDLNYNRFGVSADMYRPNDLSLYLRGKYKFTNNIGAMIGIDDVMHKDKRNFLFGLSFEY